MDVKADFTDLDAMVASVEEWLWEVDEKGVYTYSSPQVEDILGYSPEEILGKTPFDFMPPVEAQRVGKIFAQFVEGHTTFHFLNNVNLHKSGKEVLLETSGKPFFDSNGNYCGYRGVDRDITNRKTNEDLLDALRENIPGVLFIYTESRDGVTNISNVSSGCESVWGLSSKEIGNDPSVIWDRVHRDDLDEVMRAVAISKEQLEKWDHTYRYVMKSGAIKWLRAIGTPKESSIDHTVSWTTIVTDVTDSITISNEKSKSLTLIVKTLSKAVAARDPYTANHEDRVTKIANTIARKMGLDADLIAGLELASLIHDIGKIQISADILCKPSKLSPAEFELIKSHSEIGASFLEGIIFEWPLAAIIRQHHERIDGSGYPKGLVGKDILIEARILAVADTIEAMASHRPYRAALGVADATAEIRRGSGVIYDSNVAEAALALLGEGEVQKLLGVEATMA